MKEPILFNRCGSDVEIENSVIGEDLVKGSGQSYQAGKFGNGFYCEHGSATAYTVLCPQLPSGTLIPMAAFSLGFWFKRTDAWHNSNSRFFTRVTAATAFNMFISSAFDINIYIHDAGGNTNHYLWNYGSSADVLNAFCPIGTWVYWRIIFEDAAVSGDKIRFYRDGNRINHSAISNEAFTGTPATLGANIVMGGSTSNLQYMGGIMDNFQIWDYINENSKYRYGERGFLNDLISAN